MKQGTLEWPSELQSSILSDRQSSKSQKDGLYVENVPFAGKECQQEGPQKRQWSLFIYLFILSNTLHYSYIWAKRQRKPCSILQLGNTAKGSSRHDESSKMIAKYHTVISKIYT